MRIFKENLIPYLLKYLDAIEILNIDEIVNNLVKFSVRINDMEPINLEGKTKELQIKTNGQNINLLSQKSLNQTNDPD